MLKDREGNRKWTQSERWVKDKAASFQQQVGLLQYQPLLGDGCKLHRHFSLAKALRNGKPLHFRFGCGKKKRKVSHLKDRYKWCDSQTNSFLLLLASAKFTKIQHAFTCVTKPQTQRCSSQSWIGTAAMACGTKLKEHTWATPEDLYYLSLRAHGTHQS